MKPHCAFQTAAAFLILAFNIQAGLNITVSEEDFVPRAGQDANVMCQHVRGDRGGTTSLRFSADRVIDDNKFPPGSTNRNRIAPPMQRQVQQRDRDLGQTFLTGAAGFRVDAIYLRAGPSDKAVLEGARGARMALQFFEVIGSPRLNDSGTPGFHGKFDRMKSPELDDYLEGEIYRPLHVATNGILPAHLKADYYMKWDLTGADEIVLHPHRHYAFVVLFMERGKDRSMSLANEFYGSHRPDSNRPLLGHGIRREGGFGREEAPYFKPDLPDDLEARLQHPPGTLGFPDVCTWRDLFFTLTAVPGSQFHEEPSK